MSTLDFKGKQIVYAHHLTVPPRTLALDAKKSLPAKGKKSSLDDNLVIHGDNLHALKALLPRYGGKISCIYIDPPYNTGNEKWVYNDNVNSPMMREWLKKASPVDGEDLERHDKWLCMMWPRLQLLRELLAEDGVIFVSIDDNEQHRLRMIMDEIFGEENFVAEIVAQTNPRGRSLRQDLAKTHEYILGYAGNSSIFTVNEIPKSEKTISEYKEQDEKGWYRLLRLRNTGIQFFNRETRPNLYFPIYVNPHDKTTSLARSSTHKIKVLPLSPSSEEGCWTWSKDKIKQNPGFIVGKLVRKNEWRIYRKDYLPESGSTTKERALWTDKEINHEIGKEILNQVFGKAPFEYPKSPYLISKAIRLASDKDAIILDSFAGSGTTAHAVLELNKEDGGNRKFILVECEDYANKITAERVRRVIKGVPKAKDKTLKEGLGGSFSYCTLGDEISAEKMLSGQHLPDYETLARHVVWAATGQSPNKIRKARGKDGFFCETKDHLFYLIYKPETAFLRSNESALNIERAKRIAKQVNTKKKAAVVYAAHKFMGQKELTQMGITFCQLPYEIT